MSSRVLALMCRWCALLFWFAAAVAGVPLFAQADEPVAGQPAEVVMVCRDGSGVCTWSPAKGWRRLWQPSGSFAPPYVTAFAEDRLLMILGATGGQQRLVVFSAQEGVQAIRLFPYDASLLSSVATSLPDGSLALYDKRSGVFEVLQGKSPLALPGWAMGIPAGCWVPKVAPDGSALCLWVSEDYRRIALWSATSSGWRREPDLPHGVDGLSLSAPSQYEAVSSTRAVMLNAEQLILIGDGGASILNDAVLWLGRVDGELLATVCESSGDAPCRAGIVRVTSGGELERLPIELPPGAARAVHPLSPGRWIIEMEAPGRISLVEAQRRDGAWQASTVWSQVIDW